MKRIKIYYGLAFLLLLTFSCTKELDFDKADQIDINFGLSVPIMTAHLNLNNFIDSNENVIIDSDGGLKVAIREDNIFDFSLNDFTSVPDQELFKEDILIGNVDIGFNAPLENLGDLTVDEFTFESGRFEFKAITSTTDPVTIKIKIKNGVQAGNVAIFEFTTTGLTTYKSFDLDGLKMDFTGPTGSNQLDLEYSSSASSAHIGTSLELTCNALEVEVQSIKGDFGNLEVDIPSNEFEFNIDGFDKFVDGLYFTNPKFNLEVQNQLGFSLGLDLELSGENTKGEKKDLTTDPLIITQPVSFGMTTDETISINKGNSNLPDLLSISPNKIEYGGKVRINPGSAPYNNYLHKDYHCQGSLDVQIPLEIKVNDLVYETLMEDTELLSDDSHKIHSADLLFKVTNTFPLGANIDMILLDELQNDIDTIVLPLLVAAPVDLNGITTEAIPNEFTVKFTEQNIQNLYDTQHIKFIGHLSSTDNGTKNVKIIDSYDIEIKLAIKVNASIESDKE